MADKKLLEENVIARFQQLANIPKTSKGSLNEAVKLAGGVPQEDEKRFAGRRSVAGLREETMDEVDEAMYDEAAGEEEAAEAPTDMGDMGDMAGDDMGATGEGGDLESAVSNVVDALNSLLDAAGMSDKQVELDSGSEGEEAPDMGGEEDEEEEEEGMPAPVMEKKKAEKPVEEELDESIELVDDELIETLLQRVTARLVAEARKTKALEEGKKGGKAGNWLAKPKHSKPPKAKGNPVKGGTPFKGGKK